jgi:AraC-like DNA-binding protein
MEILIQTAIYAGPLVIIVLFSHAFRKNSNNAFLALSLLCIWYGILATRLIISRQIFDYPALIRTGNIVGYLIYPFLYIFVRNTFYPGKTWRTSDLLLLLPALVYVIDMWPFYFAPVEEKIAVFRESLSNLQKLQRVSEGWMKLKGLHFILRYAFSFLLLVLIIRMIYRNRDNMAWQTGSLVNRPFYFMVFLTILYSPLLFPGIFGAIFHAKWFDLKFLENSLTISLIGVIIFLIFSPEVLYGYLRAAKWVALPKGSPERSAIDPEEVAKESRKEIENLLQMEMLMEKIDNYLKERKPFLQHGFSIRDLSKELSIPVYQISYIINNKYDRHFSNWLNNYRIEYFLELARSEQHKNITLEALAKDAGFSNRITFINAFKREKGMSPGAFLKLQKV